MIKVGIVLNEHEALERRKLFQNNVKIGIWHACVASADLRYHIPILLDKKGRFNHSLPIEFRRLGIPSLMRKSYADARRAAEDRILHAAAIRGEAPPLLTLFEKKRAAWTRTRNVFDRQQQSGAVELRRFRPQEIGWRHCVRRVISLDLSHAAKIVLLYAYDRGFESGEFFASARTISDETGIHTVHVKRVLAHLANLQHFERLGQNGPKRVWRYAFLAPFSELGIGNLKLPQQEQSTGIGNLKLAVAATLGSIGGNLPLPKADKASRNEPARTNNRELLALDIERELFDQLAEIIGTAEMQKHGGMWRTRIRRGKEERRALRHTIEDYKILTPDQRRAIRNVPAWFTDRYQRNLVKISAVA